MTERPVITVIHDGDHGSDDFIATLVFISRPDVFDLVGVTTGFGNTSCANAARNAGAALRLAGRQDIPLYRGSEHPLLIPPKTGDGAFGDHGLGDVPMPEGPKPRAGDAVEWMARTLLSSPVPVTLCPTGLMTNTAKLLRDYPETKPKIARIVAMGGCLGPLPGGRRGNITPWAEFNFFMDPDAAQFVLNSGVPVVLLPMDATHQLVFTPERQVLAAAHLPDNPGRDLIRIMRVAEQFDLPKFDQTGAVVHDQTVPLFLLKPDLFRGRDVTLRIDTDAASERHGQMHVVKDGGPVYLVENLDPDAVFDLMLDCLTRLFPQ